MAIKGAILGDILGSQYEFSRPNNLDWQNVPLINRKIEFTDDTVMSLAIKKTVDQNLNFTKEELINNMVELGLKYPDAGYGWHFCCWLRSNSREPYNSFGNGAAMRVSYIGEAYKDYNEMQKAAEETAAVSHNHPEGIKGAIVAATCVWMAKNGRSKEDIYNYVLEQYPEEEYPYSIKYSLDEIRPKYKWDITCQGSVPVAMRCFYESNDYESFIRNIYSLPCDSDTLGAIAGGVAEEYYQGFGIIDVDKIITDCLDDNLTNILA